MATYPEETVAKAEFELRIFECLAQDTGVELLAEVIAWRKRYPNLRLRPDGSFAPTAEAAACSSASAPVPRNSQEEATR